MKKAIKAKSAGKKALSLVAAFTLLTTGSVSSMFAFANTAVEKGNLASNGKYYTDYETMDEAMAAAKDLNLEIAAEAMVLLKNQNRALPMSTSNYVSVFGVREDSLTGGSGSVHASLENAGFRVNPKLAKFYASDSSAIGSEKTEFGAAVESSFSLYNDAAVVIFSRTGGEGSDPVRIVSNGANAEWTDDENVDGWEHEALVTDNTDGDHKGDKIKHYFMLTESENELLNYVKERFGKVVVVLNSSAIMEMYNLEHDERIDAIISMDRPGVNGVEALGKVLSGEINPSGKTADVWYRDFTADPTWYNFGNNSQTSGSVEYKAVESTSSMGGGSQTSMQWVGSNTSNFQYKNADNKYEDLTQISGVSYEEGIYVGYKYYETVWAEIAAGHLGISDDGWKYQAGTGTKEDAEEWYGKNVVYPFGHGLSYTEFEMGMGKVYYELEGKNVELSASVDASLFNSSVTGGEAKVKTLYAPVTIKNTGSVAGKQVAEIYVTAPYITGGIEKSHVKLVGYAKTKLLAPGEEQTVVVSFNVQDFASFDYLGKNDNDFKTYELDLGKYEIKLMSDSHTVVESQEFELKDTAVLELDDYTGNKVGATDFSNPNSEYYTLINPEVKFSDGEPQWKGKALYGSEASMTIMSRNNFVSTFPEHNPKDYTLTKELLQYLDKFCATTTAKDADLDNEHAKWYLSEKQLEDLMDGWTQADNAAVAARTNGKCKVLLREMAGVPLYAEDGVTINEKWTKFMNQLSFDEIARLITQCSQSSPSIASIGKIAARNIDGPNSTAGMSWYVESGIGCTWNVDLSYKQGIMVGNLYTLKGYTSWYAPATNMHRSPFGGRNNEYYSSDGIHAGYLTAAAAYGCESRGVNCYLKHFALNDQETARTNLVTYADEQNIRENYLIPFQMGVQEGRASALMLTFSRIGVVPSAANYVFLQEITRDEWGFTGVIGTDFFPYKQSGFTVGGGTTSTADDYKFVGGNTTVMDTMIRSGGVHPLGNGSDLSAKWDDTKKAVVVEHVAADGTKTTTEAPLDYYYARLFATRICYVYANSVNLDNGLIFGENYTMIYDYVDKTRQPQPDTREWQLEAGKVGQGIKVSLAATNYELGNDETEVTNKYEALLEVANTVALEKVDANEAMVNNQLKDGYIAVTSGRNTNYYNTNKLNAGYIKTGTGNNVKYYSETSLNENYMQKGEGDNAKYYYVTPTNVPTYSVVEGSLPAGLTLNAKTGLLTGTPTKAGNYEFTVRAKIDRNYGEAIIKLSIAESLTVSGETTIDIGGELNIILDYNETIDAQAYTSFAYSAKGLPAGVKVDETGHIVGTPTEAGVYNAEVTMTAKKGSGNSAVTDTYIYNVKITVNAAEPFDVEAAIAAINAKLEALEKGLEANDLTQIKADIAALKAVEPVDLSALEARVKALEEKPAEAGGCNSSVSLVSAGLVLVPVLALGAAAVVVKRKRNNG